MTTTRFAIERISLECEGATVTILSTRDEWSDSQQLCLEITTNDTTSDDGDAADPNDPEIPLYCPPSHDLARRAPPSKNPATTRRRALLVLAVIAATALLAGVAVASRRGPQPVAARATPSPTNVVTALGADSSTPTDTTVTTEVTISRALAADTANMTISCRHVLTAAAAALGTDDSSLLRSLIADHQGQTLNGALHQQLTDARAVLASRPGPADTTSLWTSYGLDALAATISSLWSSADVDAFDATIADVDATPCSPRDDSRLTSPAPISVKAK